MILPHAAYVLITMILPHDAYFLMTVILPHDAYFLITVILAHDAYFLVTVMLPLTPDCQIEVYACLFILLFFATLNALY